MSVMKAMRLLACSHSYIRLYFVYTYMLNAFSKRFQVNAHPATTLQLHSVIMHTSTIAAAIAPS